MKISKVVVTKEDGLQRGADFGKTFVRMILDSSVLFAFLF